MKILAITRVYPYPSYAGDLIYNAGLINALAEQSDVELDVLCGNETPQSGGVGPVRKWIGPQGKSGRTADIRSLFTGYPRAAERALGTDALQALRKALKETQYDAVLLLETSTAKAMPLVLESGVACIYVSHNVDFEIRPTIAKSNKTPILGLLQKWDAHKYARTERDLIDKASGITAITGSDAQKYREIRNDLTIPVLTPGYGGTIPEAVKPLAHSHRVICLVGSFEWNAKQSNLLEILAAYAAHFSADDPKAPKLRIAGRIPEEFCKKIQAQYPHVQLRREFSDIKDVLEDARICISLDRLGGGFKLKVLDYVMNGVPIVAFDESITGSGLDKTTEYISVGSYQEAMQVIDQTIDNLDALQSISQAAFEKSKTRFKWETRALIIKKMIKGFKPI